MFPILENWYAKKIPFGIINGKKVSVPMIFGESMGKQVKIAFISSFDTKKLVIHTKHYAYQLGKPCQKWGKAYPNVKEFFIKILSERL